MKNDNINQSEQGWKLQKNSSVTNDTTEHSSILETVNISSQNSHNEDSDQKK